MNKIIRVLILAILFNLCYNTAFAWKSPHYDSLRNLIRENPTTSLDVLRKHFEEASIKVSEHEAEAAFLLGYNYYHLNKYRVAVKYYLICLKKISKNEGLKITVHNNLGVCYDYLEENNLSIENYLIALRIAEEIKDEKEVAGIHINIGLIYAKLNNEQLAKEHLFKSLDLSKKLKEDTKIALCYQNLAYVYNSEGNYDSLMYYFDKAIQLHQTNGSTFHLLQCFYNKAIILYELKDYPNSIIQYKRTIFQLNPESQAYLLANTYLMLSRSFFMNGNYDSAIYYDKESRRLFEETGAEDIEESLLINSLMLSKRNSDSTFKDNLVAYIGFMSKKQNESLTTAISEMQTIYDLEKKNLMINSKQKVIEKKNVILSLSLIFIIILLGLIFILLYEYKVIRNKNEIIDASKQTISELDKEVKVFQESFAYNEEKLKEVFQSIQQLIHKGYHLSNNNISLTHLAKKLASNEAYVSYAINKFSGDNFNKFFNRNRIMEAQKLLSNPTLKDLNLESIAQNCGFASQNTFFRAFKEFTGMTPTEFRKKQNKKQ